MLYEATAAGGSTAVLKAAVSDSDSFQTGIIIGVHDSFQ